MEFYLIVIFIVFTIEMQCEMYTNVKLNFINISKNISLPAVVLKDLFRIQT